MNSGRGKKFLECGTDARFILSINAGFEQKTTYSDRLIHSTWNIKGEGEE
jgi:hypothetical protein